MSNLVKTFRFCFKGPVFGSNLPVGLTEIAQGVYCLDIDGSLAQFLRQLGINKKMGSIKLVIFLLKPTPDKS